MTNYTKIFSESKIKEDASFREKAEFSRVLFNYMIEFLNNYSVDHIKIENDDFTFNFIPTTHNLEICGYVFKDVNKNVVKINDYSILCIRFHGVNIKVGDVKEEMILNITTNKTTIKIKVVADERM